MEKIDSIRETAGRQLQHFFKFVAPNCIDFAQKAELQVLFTQVADQVLEHYKYLDLPQEGEQQNPQKLDDSGISYLAWRNADFVFEQVMPFYDSKTYGHRIFTGLITSSGGLTESTLKAS